MRAITLILLLSNIAKANDFEDVRDLALNNGFSASNRVIQAVIDASHTFGLRPLDLAAIGILESGLQYKVNSNRNGTTDIGVFQINSVNLKYCLEYNLKNVEGNAHCAAKLLKRLRSKHKKDYLGRYHSKTPSKKSKYLQKIEEVLNK